MKIDKIAPKMIIGVCLAFSVGAETYASENGMTSYPLGVNTILGGIYPEPGATWVENYTQVYHARSFNNSSGSNSVPGFEATVAVDSVRIVHSWDAKIGPFGLTSVLNVPLVYANVRTAFGSNKNYGVSNIAIEPAELTWSAAGGSLVGYATAIAFLPTGSDVSNDFYTVSPVVAATWFPNRNWVVSATLGAEFHTKNNKTNYQSGSISFLEYGIDYHPVQSLPKLAIGVGGYAAKQFTDDKLNGQRFQDGFRQQVVSVGPQITYGDAKGGFALKWQHEVSAKNRSAGDRIWLQFFFPL